MFFLNQEIILLSFVLFAIATAYPAEETVDVGNHDEILVAAETAHHQHGYGGRGHHMHGGYGRSGGGNRWGGRGGYGWSRG
ncbi:hypothetical protein RN001_000277 [Aquatica leii]|uniref:Uncharacterized protein n=1 Tax=Aquatica leii TaxID=1421715 RepID=A0AAN7PJW0_9COLE|nr:hypothetical protein RN001_000277 [Aquatica leii]